MKSKTFSNFTHAVAIASLLLTSACAWVDAPDARNVNIPAPTAAQQRKTAINERPDSVMYLPLGEDVLVPEVSDDSDFPHEIVGPFELRGETLAGALQLILADYDISLAFETQQGLSRRITVANLRGDLGTVVDQVCSLANLYCAYENGSVTVKDTQTFTVTLPPIGNILEDETDFMENVAQGLTAILGSDVPAPIVDVTTRTLVYSATQRTAEIASRYFQRLRANTAMIVFETYIWEVALDSGNSTGIQWDKIATFGKFDASIDINGNVGAEFLNPVTIGLPTAHEITGTPTNLVELLSQFGAVKTISQPQITMLSGAEAELRVADTRNYVSEISTTLDEGQSTTSVNTDSVDTGFTLTIGSSWDKSTVYANVNIELTDVQQIDDFSFSDGGTDGATTTIQLPQTSERQLNTHIRVRPGDAVLIAGLVRENDRLDSTGIGFMQPILPDSRTAVAQNLELVILLRPRVVIYTAANDKRYVDYAMKKHKMPGMDVKEVSSQELGEDAAAMTPEPLGAPAPSKAPVVAAPAPKSVSVAPVQPTPVYPKPAETPAPAAQPKAIVPSVIRPRVSPAMPETSSAKPDTAPRAVTYKPSISPQSPSPQSPQVAPVSANKPSSVYPAAAAAPTVAPVSSLAPAAPWPRQAATPVTTTPSSVPAVPSAPLAPATTAPRPPEEEIQPSVSMFESEEPESSPTDQISIFPTP